MYPLCPHFGGTGQNLRVHHVFELKTHYALIRDPAFFPSCLMNAEVFSKTDIGMSLWLSFFSKS